MDRLRVPNELGHVEHYKTQFDQFKEIAERIIQRLHSDYKSGDVIVGEIENNTFRFFYWGLEFIVKAEIAFDEKGNIFNKGELNTYLVDQDSLLLVFSVEFDSFGKINGKYDQRNFTMPYYSNFVSHLLRLSSEGKINFQL